MSCKKKIKRDKGYKCETKQVFNYLKMPHQFKTEETTILVGGGGAANDSYHRWYPGKVSDPDEVGAYCMFRDEAHRQAGQALNEWLIDHGMKVDEADKYFHVLIFVSW